MLRHSQKLCLWTRTVAATLIRLGKNIFSCTLPDHRAKWLGGDLGYSLPELVQIDLLLTFCSGNNPAC